MKYYKRFMGDYGRDTAHLSLAEHGAYTLLLDHYYSTEQPLPADPSALYRICRAFDKAEQRAVLSVAEAFFPVAPDGLRHNERADRQIPEDRRVIEAARANGKKGGRPIKPTQAEPDPMPRAEPNQNPSGFDPLLISDSGSKPETQTHQTPDSRQEQRSKSLEQRAARFDEFWAVYPNRKSKAKALAAWRRKGLDRIADRIIADVKARASGDRQWLDGFIPHGSTYVNGEGWEDAIEPPKLRAIGGTAYVPLPGEV